MASDTGVIKTLLKRCNDASRNTGGMVWIALGIVFLAMRYIGLGVAFMVIGIGRVARNRSHVSRLNDQ